MRNNNISCSGIDWIAILTYLALIFMGWISIYAAVFNEEHASMFDMSQIYGSQVMWIGICMFLAISILLIDVKYYFYLASPAYIFLIIVLIATIFLGTEVKGARSWFSIGSFRIQPAEFGKFTTALMLAKYMSSYNFDIRKIKSLLGVSIILAIPFVIILKQNDTGSALVYGSFLFMLYREGLNRWVYSVIFMAIALFLFSFIIETSTLYILILLIILALEGFANGFWREKIIYLGLLSIIFIVVYSLFGILNLNISSDNIILISVALSLPIIFIYAYKRQIKNVIMFIGFFVAAVIFTVSVDYIFDNMLQIHQQKRILDLIGVEEDIKNWGYNVNQSKIAIGSGGMYGKGFLQGTQTKYDFVPEQSTDFIFCTISEEMGFMGSFIVLMLFGVLIFRLMRMGDRQHEMFGRVYCYSVASIFFFHVLINIGMTIGLAPVIGIPLPFFSYGGSSLISFTLLLFVAIRFNMNNKERNLL